MFSLIFDSRMRGFTSDIFEAINLLFPASTLPILLPFMKLVVFVGVLRMSIVDYYCPCIEVLER